MISDKEIYGLVLSFSSEHIACCALRKPGCSSPWLGFELPLNCFGGARRQQFRRFGITFACKAVMAFGFLGAKA